MSEMGQRILDLIASGEISTREGEERLRALHQRLKKGNLEIQVNDMSSGRREALIRIPMRLIEWGMSLENYHAEIEGLDMGEVMESLLGSEDTCMVVVEDFSEGKRVQISLA